MFYDLRKHNSGALQMVSHLSVQQILPIRPDTEDFQWPWNRYMLILSTSCRRFEAREYLF